MSFSEQEVSSGLLTIKDCLCRLSAKVIIVKNQKLLMILEHGDDWWSLPRGGVDYGETAHESLVRELMEELGIVEDINVKTRQGH